MERAWASHDIVASILETMAPGPSIDRPQGLTYPYDRDALSHQRRRNENSLARVARVCRALSGIALDILWRCILSIFHLIDLVPECYRYERIHDDGDLDGIQYEMVSFCIVVCELMLQTLISNDLRAPYRDVFGSPANKRSILFLRTQSG